ncbi:hypothetical protein D1B33_07560 [Lysinibacillus yapensis]|uniref:Uncharacterized protein n=1 Tax=Ureibacillus yapensis TaxID=2304605 RepID=A0A396SBI1_9BACL|nr:hypothetical protein [Lysinibacillus yapensis]RHW38721.1 hypothetical protein D1B33_07560 [Lysinibacillus yapensis]
MIQFEHLRVYNFMGAIRNMRNSWESWDGIDSVESNRMKTQSNVEGFVMGENDMKLAMKLVKAGSDHAKFMRQILVSVDIIAGNEWWKEADAYKVGTVANSTSMMHTLGKRRLLTEDDISFDKPLSEIAQKQLAAANEAIQAWWDSGKKTGSPEWRDMQKAIPMGFIYRRGFTCNYQVLQNMYHSRRLHRLAEWREFAKWVESLPYAELITGKVTKSKKELEESK